MEFWVKLDTLNEQYDDILTFFFFLAMAPLGAIG